MKDTEVSTIDYLSAIADERDKRYQQRFESQEKAVNTAVIAQERRLDALNELRQGVATTIQIEALEKVVDDVKDRLNRMEGGTTGSQLTKANLISYLLVGFAFVTLIVLLANHVLK
jgi:hypothetical protein